MYDPGGCKPLTSACQPTRVTSADPVPAALYATSSGDVVAPAHLFPLELVNRSGVPVPRVESFVVYPKNPVFTFALVPSGDVQDAGAALVPVNLSILFVLSCKGGSVVVFTVTVYPFGEFVNTEISCAAIFGAPEDNTPNGMLFAVVVLTLIDAPLTDPDVAAATENENVEPTSAVTARDVDVKIANASVALSITVEPVSEYVVTRAKYVVSAEVELVIPVYDTVTACVDCDAGVVITVVNVPFPVNVSVLPVPAKLSLALVAPVVSIPVGVVHAPDAVVQNTTFSCLIESVTVVVKAKS